MNHLAALSLLLLAVPAPVPRDTDELSERLTALEREVPRMLELARVPGISLAIATREGVVWNAAFGVRDSASGAKVDADTVFEAASLSKPVFAYLVLRLVDEGVMELETALAEYAPLADIAHDERRARITARMVLSHSSGLPNWRPQAGRLELLHDPGEKWNYSGEGFGLLQQAVEALVAQPLHDVADYFVFEPLKMKRSSFVWSDAFAANVAFPHDADGASRPNRHVTDGHPAFSLSTTASDYARFLAAMLSGQGLEPSTLALMLEPEVAVNEDGVSWGLGWGLEENEDGVSFWHWGHNDGYRAYTVSYPTRDLALVYFTNSDNGMRLLEPLVELATGEAEHPALRHLDYSGYESEAEVDDE